MGEMGENQGPSVVKGDDVTKGMVFSGATAVAEEEAGKKEGTNKGGDPRSVPKEPEIVGVGDFNAGGSSSGVEDMRSDDFLKSGAERSADECEIAVSIVREILFFGEAVSDKIRHETTGFNCEK